MNTSAKKVVRVEEQPIKLALRLLRVGHVSNFILLALEYEVE